MTTNAIYADVQKLEPGARVELFVVDGSAFGAGIQEFHGYTQLGEIIWQGVQYQPWPISVEGFDKDSGQQPTPTLSVGNVGGSMSALCLQFQDMIGATITRHATFAQYLDAANYPGGNPTANPNNEFPLDVWKISRKALENSRIVQWELENPIDIQNEQFPGRQIIANSCAWIARGGYRGKYCGYTGGPVADILDNPTTDPALDNCGGRVASCKLRNWPNDELPYGSFPAAGLVRS